MAAKPRDQAQVSDLARRARAGDPGAFRRLVEMHMQAVHALAYRFMGNHDDADDVAQETFVRAYRALDRYDETYSFYTWLRTIATRLALNEIEKRKRRQTTGGESFERAAEVVAAPVQDPTERLAEQQLRAALEEALENMPEEFRGVLALRTYEEMSYEEIAANLHIPIGTVMSRLSRARRLLRQRLQGRAPREIEERKRSS